ncbi:S10 family peptidase [Nonomuraea sp. NPDC004186]
MPGIHREAVFGGLDVKYEARVDEIVVPDSSGEPGARYVCTSYTVPGASERPVIFAFNGGPGSSSVWLHLGIGPRRVADADLLRPRMAPPFGLADNPDCVLDSADLVFIDPPGTGFSRVLDEERQADFYGVVPDAIATMRFITQWSRRHGRENSPKFLLGESYGAIRAATVAKLSAGGPTTTGRLESLALNGVILMGPGLQFGNGANLAHVTTLPSLAATAWYHDRLPGRPADVREHVEAATRFAEEDYLTALFAGSRLDRRRREAVAARLHELIGLAPGVIAEHDLRLTPQRFASLLLRDRGEQVGLYDSRYRLPLAGAGGDPVADDPAMGQYVPSFAGAIDGYLREELCVERDDDYRTIEFARVNFRWDYGDGARLPAGNYAADLAVALRRNRDLRVLLCVGMYDLVTTLGETNYALSQAPIDPERVSVRTYESGHMPYLGRASRERLAADLRAVVKAPTGEEPPCVSQ